MAFKGRRIFLLSQGCDMMQRSIMVPVLTPDQSSFRMMKSAGTENGQGRKMHWLSKFFLSQEKAVGRPAGRITASLMIRLMGSLFLVIMALILCFLVTLFVFYLIGLFFSKYFT
jgi:hypothetical protein